MIRILLGVTLFVSTANLARPAQIIINNLSGLHPIANLSGDLVPLGTGFVQVGGIDLTDAEIMASPGNKAALQAAFEEFGTSITFGAGGSGGFFSATIGSPIAPGDPLIGQNIYIVAGDGTAISDSDGIWIFKSDIQFEADAPVFEKTIGLNGALAQGEILLGTPELIFVPFIEGEFNGSRMVSIVPEPNVAFLCGFASLLLLSRRCVRGYWRSM